MVSRNIPQDRGAWRDGFLGSQKLVVVYLVQINMSLTHGVDEPSSYQAMPCNIHPDWEFIWGILVGKMHHKNGPLPEASSLFTGSKCGAASY